MELFISQRLRLPQNQLLLRVFPEDWNDKVRGDPMTITFQKRQKEMKRREKQKEKEIRREQRKLAKREGKEAGQTNEEPVLQPDSNEPV